MWCWALTCWVLIFFNSKSLSCSSLDADLGMTVEGGLWLGLGVGRLGGRRWSILFLKGFLVAPIFFLWGWCRGIFHVVIVMYVKR